MDAPVHCRGELNQMAFKGDFLTAFSNLNDSVVLRAVTEHSLLGTTAVLNRFVSKHKCDSIWTSGRSFWNSSSNSYSQKTASTMSRSLFLLFQHCILGLESKAWHKLGKHTESIQGLQANTSAELEELQSLVAAGDRRAISLTYHLLLDYHNEDISNKLRKYFFAEYTVAALSALRGSVPILNWRDLQCVKKDFETFIDQK